MLHPLTQNRHLSFHNSLLLLSQGCPGCQRLFMRGFRFLLSLFNWSARKAFFLAASPLLFSVFARKCVCGWWRSSYPKGGWSLRSLSQGNLTSTCLYVLTVIRVTKNEKWCGLSEKEFIIFFVLKIVRTMRKMSVDGANKTRGVLPIITCTGRLRLKGEPFPGTVYEQGFH